MKKRTSVQIAVGGGSRDVKERRSLD